MRTVYTFINLHRNYYYGIAQRHRHPNDTQRFGSSIGDCGDRDERDRWAPHRIRAGRWRGFYRFSMLLAPRLDGRR